MKKLLLLALLVVGCDNATEPENSLLLGKWQVIGIDFWMAVFPLLINVDDFIEITENKYIVGKEIPIWDDNPNIETETCFADIIYNYLDNQTNLIISYQNQIEEATHITYQLNNNQLHLQYLFKIHNGDTTHCVNCSAIAIEVSEIPEYNCP